VLNALWPLSRTAGEGAERSEAGEGLAAAEIFSQRGARAARWSSLSPMGGEGTIGGVSAGLSR
jgi:hypothetical protein